MLCKANKLATSLFSGILIDWETKWTKLKILLYYFLFIPWTHKLGAYGMFSLKSLTRFLNLLLQ